MFAGQTSPHRTAANPFVDPSRVRRMIEGLPRHRLSRRLESAMARLEKHRNTMYTEFTKILGEETAQAMLSHFPARDVEEPATRADVQLIKADIAILGAELRAEMAALSNQLTNRMITIAGLGLAAITALLAAFT